MNCSNNNNDPAIPLMSFKEYQRVLGKLKDFSYSDEDGWVKRNYVHDNWGIPVSQNNSEFCFLFRHPANLLNSDVILDTKSFRILFQANILVRDFSYHDDSILKLQIMHFEEIMTDIQEAYQTNELFTIQILFPAILKEAEGLLFRFKKSDTYTQYVILYNAIKSTYESIIQGETTFKFSIPKIRFNDIPCFLYLDQIREFGKFSNGYFDFYYGSKTDFSVMIHRFFNLKFSYFPEMKIDISQKDFFNIFIQNCTLNKKKLNLESFIRIGRVCYETHDLKFDKISRGMNDEIEQFIIELYKIALKIRF